MLRYRIPVLTAAILSAMAFTLTLESFYNTSFGNGMPIIVGILAMFCNAMLSCTERQETLRVIVSLSSVGLSLLLAVMQFVAMTEINDGNQGIICSDQDDDDVSLMCDATAYQKFHFVGGICWSYIGLRLFCCDLLINEEISN